MGRMTVGWEVNITFSPILKMLPISFMAKVTVMGCAKV